MHPASFLFIFSISVVTACSQSIPTSTLITNAVIMDGSGEPAIDAISLDSMRMLTFLPPPLSTNAQLHDSCSTNQDPTPR